MGWLVFLGWFMTAQAIGSRSFAGGLIGSALIWLAIAAVYVNLEKAGWF